MAKRSDPPAHLCGGKLDLGRNVCDPNFDYVSALEIRSNRSVRFCQFSSGLSVIFINGLANLARN